MFPRNGNGPLIVIDDHHQRKLPGADQIQAFEEIPLLVAPSPQVVTEAAFSPGS